MRRVSLVVFSIIGILAVSCAKPEPEGLKGSGGGDLESKVTKLKNTDPKDIPACDPGEMFGLVPLGVIRADKLRVKKPKVTVRSFTSGQRTIVLDLEAKNSRKNPNYSADYLSYKICSIKAGPDCPCLERESGKGFEEWPLPACMDGTVQVSVAACANEDRRKSKSKGCGKFQKVFARYEVEEGGEAERALMLEIASLEQKKFDLAMDLRHVATEAVAYADSKSYVAPRDPAQKQKESTMIEMARNIMNDPRTASAVLSDERILRSLNAQAVAEMKEGEKGGVVRLVGGTLALASDTADEDPCQILSDVDLGEIPDFSGGGGDDLPTIPGIGDMDDNFGTDDGSGTGDGSGTDDGSGAGDGSGTGDGSGSSGTCDAAGNCDGGSTSSGTGQSEGEGENTTGEVDDSDSPPPGPSESKPGSALGAEVGVITALSVFFSLFVVGKVHSKIKKRQVTKLEAELSELSSGEEEVKAEKLEKEELKELTAKRKRFVDLKNKFLDKFKADFKGKIKDADIKEKAVTESKYGDYKADFEKFEDIEQVNKKLASHKKQRINSKSATSRFGGWKTKMFVSLAVGIAAGVLASELGLAHDPVQRFGQSLGELAKEIVKIDGDIKVLSAKIARITKNKSRDPDESSDEDSDSDSDDSAYEPAGDQRQDGTDAPQPEAAGDQRQDGTDAPQPIDPYADY